ncbi:hypothetical protein RNZ50_02120 [Paracoccaceae bacterium Fryx2]|nr:hypothetical protein [Paracoccaceae bacterium Fryx2]
MNMISSISLYSGRHEIVPSGTEAVGGENVAKIGEAAVKCGPAAEPRARQRRNRAMRQRRAEAAVLGRKVPKGGLQGVVEFDVGSGAAILTVPGGKTVRLDQRFAYRHLASGQRHLERQQRPALRAALLVVTDCNPRSLVAQDQASEGPKAAA